MIQSTPARLRRAIIAAAAIVVGAAAVARAQELPRDADDVEPWRPAAHDSLPRHATSSIDATKATAADQRETRTLATAIFAKPGAAQRAADKAAAALKPPIPPAEPKAEWLAEDSVRFGGKGLELTAPF